MPKANRLPLPGAPLRKQFANKAGWNESRPPETADFFTFGYSGRKTDEILDALRIHRIRTVLDIRRNPVSMYRPELSKNNFSTLLAQHGIRYVHVPSLGVPREIRAQAIETGNREVIWEWYDENVVPLHLTPSLFLDRFEHPVALMCTEIDPHECHRHRLALALEGMGLNGFDL